MNIENDIARAAVLVVGIGLLVTAAWIISSLRATKRGIRIGREQGVVERAELLNKLKDLEGLAQKLQAQLEVADTDAGKVDRATARETADVAHEAGMEKLQAFSDGMAEGGKRSNAVGPPDVERVEVYEHGSDVPMVAVRDDYPDSPGSLRSDEVSAPMPVDEGIDEELDDPEPSMEPSMEPRMSTGLPVFHPDWEEPQREGTDDEYLLSGRRPAASTPERPLDPEKYRVTTDSHTIMDDDLDEDELEVSPATREAYMSDPPFTAPVEEPEHPVAEEPVPDDLEPEVAVELPEEMLDAPPSVDDVQTERVADPSKPGLPLLDEGPKYGTSSGW